MAENKKTLQLRMETVDKVSKITNAMKLISLSKLQKFQKNIKGLEELAREYNNVPTEPYANGRDLPVLAICISADLGLASLYNQTIYKSVEELNPDALLWLGYQGYDRLQKNPNIELLNDKTSSDHLDIQEFYGHVMYLLRNYQLKIAVPEMNGETLEVTWKNLSLQLLHSDFVIYEPNYEVANQRYQDFYIFLTLNQAYYQSKYTEYLTRRIAMEQATENANEMREELRNRYNKVRQEEITQEILELSSGVE